MFVLLALANGARANDAIQSLASIEQAVHAYVAAASAGSGDVEFHIGRLDPRLRLVACDAGLETRFNHEPRGTGPAAVEVRCPGTRPWVLYVGVTLERYADAVVAVRPIARGALIGADDVTRARRRLAGAEQDYFDDAARVVGQVATRPIAIDQVLPAAAVRLPEVIKRGDDVILAGGGNGISVRVKGTALEAGAIGARISVRNANSRRVVQGIVGERGVVIVAGASVL